MLYGGMHAKIYHVVVAVVPHNLADILIILIFKLQTFENLKCGIGVLGFWGQSWAVMC